MKLRPLLHDQSGIALVMALMVLTVLTIVISTTIMYSTQSQHESGYGKAKNYAYTMAENGINNAMAVLRMPPDPVTGIGNNALDKAVFCGVPGYITGTTNPCTMRNNYDGGYVIWSGTLDQGKAQWTITSTGYVTNPAKASGTATRTLSVKVNVHPTLTQPLNTPVWNYIYSTNGPSPVPTCDMDLFNSVTIASPLYVEGNLCLHNTSSITKGPLVVRGRLYMDSNRNNYVGTSTLAVSDAHIVNGCDIKGNLDVPCRNNGVDQVWATVLDTTSPTGLSPPVPNWNNWYLNASPGPYFPCTTTTGTPPVFDNLVTSDPAATDATRLTYMNNSAGIQDLTPGYSYSCKTAGGELTWNNTAKLLTIKGTIFIDGSVYVNNGSINTYTGQGVIYLRGTLLIKNSSLCGAVYNGGCDLRNYQASPRQGWDPNSTLICFVANATGGQVTVGDSIQVVSGTLQGAAYATGGLTLDTTANVDGPLVGAPVKLGQSVTTSFPSITLVPQGMPSNPTAYAQADPPSDYSG